MDVYTVIRASLRRWYILVPLLILVALVSIFQARQADATYTQSAQLLLAGQPSVSTPEGETYSNPLVNSGTALTVLVTRLNAPESLVANSVDGGVVTASAQTRAPILILLAQGTSATAVTQSLDLAIKNAPEELLALEATLDVDPAVKFRLTQVVVDPSPAALYPSRTRSVVITALIGALLAIVIADIADVILWRRRRDLTIAGATDMIENTADTDPQSRHAATPGEQSPPVKAAPSAPASHALVYSSREGTTRSAVSTGPPRVPGSVQAGRRRRPRGHQTYFGNGQ